MNQGILNRLNASGELYLTHTKLDGKYTLRMSIGQSQTERRHVEQAWEKMRAAAAELAQGSRVEYGCAGFDKKAGFFMPKNPALSSNLTNQGPDYPRSTYSPVRVSILTESPSLIKAGALSTAPVSSVTFLSTLPAVSPRTEASA